MKLTSLLGITILTLFLINCKKSKDTANQVNCDGLITDTLGTGDNAKIYMPNAFSPNSDGINDISRPIILNVASIDFTIFDGDNHVMFHTNSLYQGWHPTTSPDTWSAYFYKIQATTSAGHHIGLCGEVFSLSCFPSSIPKSSLHFEDQLIASIGVEVPTNETLGTCP
jgi:hypothetical protein